MTSVDNIIAILRHYRAHSPLSKGPIIFIYGAIMAGTALSFTRESYTVTTSDTTTGDQTRCQQETEIHYQATSIIKLLEEVSDTCPPAREASLRLKACFGNKQPSLLGPHEKQQADALEDQSYSYTIRHDLEDDQDWSRDQMELLGSMDPGILDLMPMEWADFQDVEEQSPSL
jgi:hypothetical protein